MSANLNELHFEQRSLRFPFCIYNMRSDMYVHAHIEFEILYVQEGRIRLYVDDTLRQVNAGEAIVINSGSIHFGFASPDARYHALLCGDQLFLKNSAEPDLAVFSRIMQGELRFTREIICEERSPQLLAVIRQLYELFRSEEPFWRLQAVAAYYSFAALCLETGFLSETPLSQSESGTMQKNISLYIQFTRHVHQHYMETLSIPDIAKALNVSESRLYKVCRTIQGYSPIEYVNRYRLTRAVQLLKAGDAPITEIGLSCGFGNVSYFIARFKEFYGITPYQFRRENTEK